MKTHPRIFILRSLLSGLAVFFIFSQLQAQAPDKVKLFKKKLKKIEIVDPGELMSGFTLSEEQQATLKSQGLSAAFVKEIAAYCHDGGWEGMMTELDNRVGNPEILKAYNAYLVSRLDDDTRIIAIPKQHNSHQPEGWTMGHNFYIVIGKVGIEE